jgi:molecular chaperone DnaJ
VRESIFGQFVTSTPCDRCGGEGVTVESPCRECRGRGQVQATTKLAVNVPAGVDDGTTIRLAGQGEAGVRGGPPGNLYVVVKVRPHKLFKRDGLDIILDLDVNIAQAALGDEVEVPLADGKTQRITVPAGAQFGDTVVLREKGVPDLRSGRRGDQIVRLNVIVPKNLNDEQKRLLKDLAEAFGTPVRAQDDKGILGQIKDALGV